MKTTQYQQAMDQVNLSTEADERISAAIEAARQEQKVIPLPGGRAKKSVFRFGRAAVIAAVLAGLLTVTALAAASINYVAFRTRTAHSQLFPEISGWLEVFFEQTADGPMELGVWEPDAVPEGFEKVDVFDNPEYGYHRDTWENAAGEEFRFSYELPSTADTIYDHSMYEPNRILEQGNVTVNGVTVWYLVYRNSMDNVHTNLYWTRPDTGVGFCLSTFDLSLKDLIAIAESVTPQ